MKKPKRGTKKSNRFLALPHVVQLVVLAIIYVVTAKFGLSLDLGTQQVTTVWPPTGIALATLLLLGYRYWPSILTGAFVANILTDEPLAVAGGIAIGNTLEALVGAYLLRRVIKLDYNFRRISDFLGLLILAGVIGTAISATIGTLSLALGGLVPGEALIRTWIVWWVGDMMGILIFTPLILLYAQDRLASLRQHSLEASILFGLCSAVCLVIFSQKTASVLPLPYLVFPMIIWASLRFRQAGVVMVVGLISAIAIWGTINHLGPFAYSSSIEENLILLHIFILVSSVTAMIMGIVVAERQAAEQKLIKRSGQLKEANRRITLLLSGALEEPSLKARISARSKVLAKKKFSA